MSTTRPKIISIPSSTNSEQIPTPSWAATTGPSQSRTKLPQFSKMSRLDQLLSRNEEIYQNMRNQLEEITKSNQNIDANISSIKPYYQSGGYADERDLRDTEREKGHSDREYQDRKQGYLQNYSFNQRIQDNRDDNSRGQDVSRNSWHNNIEKIEQSTRSGHKKFLLKPQQPIQQTTQKSLSNSSLSRKSNLSHSNKNQAYLQNSQPHQEKRLTQKIPNITQSGASSYHEPDSSPIESEGHFGESVHQSGQHEREGLNIRRRLNASGRKEEAMDQRYQTFQEDQRFETVDQKQQYDEYLEKENIEDNCKPHTTDPVFLKLHPEQLPPLHLPPQSSILFIPFNRLYSSPILQQTSKKQLTLARKSKTQVVASNSINRIVNGIKYKNVNLVSEEIGLYAELMEGVRRVEEVLGGYRRYGGDDGRGKETVDVGIIGGHNSLKKKIHYAMIAHVYADFIQQVSSLFEHSFLSEPGSYESYRLLFSISHQQQETNTKATIISYQGELIPPHQHQKQQPRPLQTQPTFHSFPTLSQSSQNKIILANIDAIIQQIFQQMKIKSPNNSTESSTVHGIRVTRLTLQKLTLNHSSLDKNHRKEKEEEPEGAIQTISDVKIISTNKLEQDFIEELELDISVWCVNPLVRYYDETYAMLEGYMGHCGRNRARGCGSAGSGR